MLAPTDVVEGENDAEADRVASRQFAILISGILLAVAVMVASLVIAGSANLQH